MIWRFTLVFLTSLTAFTLPVANFRAENALLLAQSSAVDPNAAIDTGQATPNISAPNFGSPLEDATSEQQAQEIKVLQQELKRRGYYSGPVDGIYGPITAEAIRNLRGQEAGQPSLTPRKFTPDPFPAISPDTPEKAATVPEEINEAADDINANTVDAASEDTSSEEINIGDNVSPETGIDRSETEPSPPTSVPEPVPADAAQPSPGLGRLLWPGLALIAVLGSFGIGFVLANRVTTNSDDEDESPWGEIPDVVARSEHQSIVQTSVNGQTATNGIGADTAVGIVVQQPSQNDNSLSVMSATDSISTTTRLAKVDVIDELVSNLQAVEPAKRRKAIWEIGQRGNSSAVQHLVNRMVDADSKEKSLILAALSEIGIRSLKPMNRALAIALQDDNPDVRKNAIRDLTRVYDLVTQISQMLGHATEDEDSEVRRTAEWALEQLNRIREAPKLKSSINTLEASRTSSELLPDEVENLKN